MKKLLCSITLLAAAGTLACAQEFVDSVDESKSVSVPLSMIFSNYLSMEVFYAKPTQDIYAGEKLELAGVWFNVGKNLVLENDMVLDVAGIFAIGMGSADTSDEDNKLDFDQYDAFLGVQAGLSYALSRSTSLSVGLMGGLDVRYAKFDYSESDDEDVAIGVFAGAYCRADWHITEHWVLTASARYMATTTKNEFRYRWEDLESDSTGYFVGSVGVKYAF